MTDASHENADDAELDRLLRAMSDGDPDARAALDAMHIRRHEDDTAFRELVRPLRGGLRVVYEMDLLTDPSVRRERLSTRPVIRVEADAQVIMWPDGRIEGAG